MLNYSPSSNYSPVSSIILALMLLVCASACSIDYGNRVGQANSTVIAFLIKYGQSQLGAFDQSRRFDHRLTPNGDSPRWRAVEPDYSKVLSHFYKCSFEVKNDRFYASCTAEADSGLRTSFYLDQTLSIRASESTTVLAGPYSPRLKLTAEEEREPLGAISVRGKKGPSR